MTEPIRTPDQIPVPKSIDFVFEMGMSKIREQNEVFDAFDTKIGVILGFIVVSIPEILGFLLLAAAENLSKSRYFTTPVAGLFLAGLFAVALATLFGFLALRTRQFAVGFSYPKLVPQANRSAGEIRALFLDDLLQSVRLNAETFDAKRKHAIRATLCALTGFACYTILTAVIFLHMVPC